MDYSRAISTPFFHMSGDSRNYYNYSPSGNARRNRSNSFSGDHNRSGQRLPPIREVVGEQLDSFPVSRRPIYDSPSINRSHPESSPRNYLPQPRPMPPPIHRDRGYRSDHDPETDSNRRLTTSGSASAYPGSQPGTYHVFAPSATSRELVTVSSSSTPQGIMRDRTVSTGPQVGTPDAKKRFECHICGRRMERQSVYNQHMITHTDERPHICATCGKTFNSKSNLNRHSLTHGPKYHPNTRYEDGPNDGGNSSSSRDYYNISRRK